MGQVLHGSAKTTHAIRGELQRSQASVANLAKRYGINEKTVLKWRTLQSVEDLPMAPRGAPQHRPRANGRSCHCGAPRAGAASAGRCLHCAQGCDPTSDAVVAAPVPATERISRLPKVDREKPKKFKSYEIGYFHIDIAELRHEGGQKSRGYSIVVRAMKPQRSPPPPSAV